MQSLQQDPRRSNLASIDKSSMVGLSSFEGGAVHRKFVDDSMKSRTPSLRSLNASEARLIAEAIGGRFLDYKLDDATEWAIAVMPLPSFEIRYFLQRYAPEFEDRVQVLFSKESAAIGLPGEDVAHFVILYANAIIHAARRVLKRELPKV